LLWTVAVSESKRESEWFTCICLFGVLSLDFPRHAVVHEVDELFVQLFSYQLCRPVIVPTAHDKMLYRSTKSSYSFRNACTGSTCIARRAGR
jgi:hypothetical protein